jgi:hypothetical protein
MHLTSPSQVSEMEAVMRRGPMTVMLIYSTSCPHCHTYMPIWKQLCKQRARKANMVSMEANVYEQTPMAAKKSVSGVPTVLFVDKEGKITEGEDIRNTRMMTTAVERGVSETQLNSGSDSSSSSSSGGSSNSMSLSEPPTPGSRVRFNPLPVLPAETISSPQTGGAYPTLQTGGSPWAAFLNAARQAAPAAALLGAYGMMAHNRRSSGLSAPRRSHRRSRRRSRSSRKAYT